MGVVSALGKNCDETRTNLYSSSPALPRAASKIQTELQLPVFELETLPFIHEAPGGFAMDMLLHALDEALSRADISMNELRKARVGVVIGTTVLCQLNNIPFYADLRRGTLPDAKPFIDYLDGNPAEYIRRHLKLHGPAVTVSNACSSGTDAIGIARLWLTQGKCDYAIAGGTDEINKVPFDGFNALGVCSKEPCRPFDAKRSGLNLGEAAGVLIMAQNKINKSPGIAVAGFGKASDAFHITQPSQDGRGLKEAILMALRDAGGINPGEMDFINAHGTGTLANDQVEAMVFSQIMPNVPFISTKSLTGHTLGAAGAIEAIFSAIMLEERRVPGSTRFETLPENMQSAPLTTEIKLDNPGFALSTSLAFGGSNSALILSADQA